jgi:vacuolar-type H+-ATPase subunit F/Vma7
MSLKIITLTIPQECVLNIEEFTPEENFQILKIGSRCLLEGRKVVAGLTHKDIIQKIKNESKEEIQKLEMNIIIEKELAKKMEERISEMYEKQIEVLSTQIKEHENKLLINEELIKIKDKFLLSYLEKDSECQFEIFASS